MTSAMPAQKRPDGSLCFKAAQSPRCERPVPCAPEAYTLRRVLHSRYAQTPSSSSGSMWRVGPMTIDAPETLPPTEKEICQGAKARHGQSAHADRSDALVRACDSGCVHTGTHGPAC